MSLYLDAIATTPVAPEIRLALEPWLSDQFGNPSGGHSRALDVRETIDEVRESVREFCGASGDDQVVFTGSGTEGNALGVVGFFRGLEREGTLLISKGEHPSLLEAARLIEREGHRVIRVGLQSSGLLDLNSVEESCRDHKVDLVSTHLANFDSGAVQPVQELARTAHRWGARVFIDGTTGAAWNSFSLKDTGADVFTFSPHRFFGLPGLGVLVKKKGLVFRPLYSGGQQESGLRPGMENIPGIVAAGAACRLATQNADQWRFSTGLLQKRFLESCRQQIGFTHLHGPEPGRERDPHHLNIAFECTEGEAVLLNLDLKGVQCTSQTGCVSAAEKVSHVLIEMGISRQQSLSSLLFGFLPTQSEEEIIQAVVSLQVAVARIREMSPAWRQRGH